MNHPKLFAFLTFFLLAVSATTVAFQKLYDGDFDRVKAGLENAARTAADSSATSPVAGQVPEAAPVSTAEIDRILSELPRLAEIPWQRADLAKAFQGSSGRICQLLKPDEIVTPVYTNTSPGTTQKRRLNALTIGLKMDPKAGKSLPSLTKSMIEGYLRDHLLAVQPRLFVTDTGLAQFSGEVQSTFFARKLPSSTIQPEPMIVQALQGLRVLGVYSPTTESGQQSPARTAVLAFRFASDDPETHTSVTGTEKNEFELMLIHVLPPENGQPRLAIFATANGRKDFQELELGEPANQTAYPSVVATIRFDEFTMMGLYPANPVVTGVHNRVIRTMSIDELQSRLEGKNGYEKVSLSDYLDELHRQPVPSLTNR